MSVPMCRVGVQSLGCRVSGLLGVYGCGPGECKPWDSTVLLRHYSKAFERSHGQQWKNLKGVTGRNVLPGLNLNGALLLDFCTSH